MRRAAIAPLLAAAALALAAAPDARAERKKARTVDPLRVGCAEFLALAPGERTRVALWLDGIVKATRNRPEEVGDTAIGHPLDPVVAACEGDPRQPLGDAWIHHYPGGQSETPPFRVTCRELSRREATIRAQMASFLDGYFAKDAVDRGERPAVSLASPRPRIDAACARRPEAKAADAYRDAR